MSKRDCGKYGTGYAAAGLLLLLFGYVFYLFYRSPGVAMLHSWPASQTLMRFIPHGGGLSRWADWMPSFIYVLAMSFLSAAVLGVGPRTRLLIPLFWMVIAAAFEAGQYFHFSLKALVPASWHGWPVVRTLDNYFVLGTFDPLDIAAGFAGMLAAAACIAWTREGLAVSRLWPVAVRYLRMTGGVLIFLLGIVCLLATSKSVPCEPTADPVYQSYDELRKPVAAAAPAAIAKSGKIYVFGNLILFNQPNQGIHVIDNADPRSPQNLLFLPIPGNIDIAVKDGILYADSYVDLVAIDISDNSSIHEVKRIEGVFPYDPYQNIQNTSVDFCTHDSNHNVVDPNQGVVVGYKMR